MTDPLRERYDAMPYRHGAIADSHPARIGAIARLMGLAAAPPDRCRVLELGCGDGMNLLPLAERFPQSHFTGVDFSPAQIAEGEAARMACGIANAELVCADLREWEPEPEAFDYVIAHGVYSWVPDAVRERLLAASARALRPEGVAYVSYNVLPGWGVLAGLRRFLLGEVAHLPTPEAQLAHAVRALGAVAQALANQPGAHAPLLRETLGELRALPPALLFHDLLAPVNDPCTVAEFTAHAARHGLHYFAEAHYATMPFEHVPADARAALAPLGLDLVRGQAFMDVLFQRWHRNSLLTRAPVSAARKGDLRALTACAIGARLRLADGDAIDLASGAKMRLRTQHDAALELDEPAEKAFVAALLATAPDRLPFPALLERGRTTLAAHGLSAAVEPPALCRLLYRLFTLDAADLLLAGDGAWIAPGDAPSPLMRYQAAHAAPVTSRWHEPVALTGEATRVLAAPASAEDFAGLAAAALLA